MKVAVVSSAEAERLGTLDARYFTGRRDGESPQAFARRRTIEEKELMAGRHEAHARRLRAEAAELRSQQP